MVKLATAREMRLYGSRRSRKRLEYTNAGLYLFSTIVFFCGFLAQLSHEPKSGLVLLLIALAFILLLNIHDLLVLAHLHSHLFLLQVAVPLLQVDRGFGYHKIEPHVLNLLIASSAFWVLGSIHNSCQIYERADALLQILQHAVQIPFLMSSFLFFAAALANLVYQLGHPHHGLDLLTCTWVWMCIIASLLLVIGGLANVVKVVKMLQMEGGINLEKLRGGPQDLLLQRQQDEDGFF